jgi:hypothetical protein
MSTITAPPLHPTAEPPETQTRPRRVYRSRNRRPLAGTTPPQDGPSFARFRAALRERPPLVAAALDDVPLEDQVLPISNGGSSWRWRLAYLVLGAAALGLVIMAWSDLLSPSGAKELPSFQGQIEDGRSSAVAPEARLDLPLSAQARVPKGSLHQPAGRSVAVDQAPRSDGLVADRE